MIRTIIALAAAVAVVSVAFAQEPGAKRREARQALEKKFEDAMTNASMEGFYTVNGQADDKPPRKDIYRIESCKKSGGDVWVVTAYIGYSKATIPVPVEVRWAGDTPMIMLTDVGLPGIPGKFSTRLLIDGSLYAGTWSHNQVKGHMWGKMSKTPGESKDKERK